MLLKMYTLDRSIYTLALDFLFNLKVPGLTREMIERYFSPFTQYEQPSDLAGIYQRLLESAQNANMKPNVIGGAINGIDRLGIVLEDFDAKTVLKKYGESYEPLLHDIVDRLQPRGEIRKEKRAIWPQYCRTILSAAQFIVQFSSADDFYRYVDVYEQDNRSRASLPLYISYEIHGIGFALACDFLKELGYVNFPKPDVHLRGIFEELGLCDRNADDYTLFKSIIRVAENAGETPYKVDKIFWLIGSGNFYNNQGIGDNGRIGSRKSTFIEFVRKQLQ